MKQHKDFPTAIMGCDIRGLILELNVHDQHSDVPPVYQVEIWAVDPDKARRLLRVDCMLFGTEKEAQAAYDKLNEALY